VNIFDLIASSVRNYFSQFKAYSKAGLALLLASCVVFGAVSGIFLIDMAIALAAGGAPGSWSKSWPHLALMLGATMGGLAGVSFVSFSLWGGFLNLCKKIGAGGGDLSDFVTYGLANSKTFFSIGMAQVLLGTILSLPGIAVMVFLHPAGLILALMGHFAAACLFFLSYPAAVMDGIGPARATIMGWKAIVKKPVAGIALYALCAFVVFGGMVLVPFYPIYYFVFASPLVAISALEYYKRAHK
jgi:hypothetical protein